MGNAVWGNGYHRGFTDGAKQGGAIGSLITLGAGGLVYGGVWAVGKLRAKATAKQLVEDTDPSVPDDPTDIEGASD